MQLLDGAGIPVPTADQLVHFRVRGDARIVGVDNGDQISHASLKADRVRLFNGKALVIVQAGERAGTATLTAEGGGLSRPPAVSCSTLAAVALIHQRRSTRATKNAR